MSDASPEVLRHTCCVQGPTRLTQSLCPRKMYIQFVSEVADLCAVTCRRCNCHYFSLGLVLESFQPKALQERTVQAAAVGTLPGGMSQMVQGSKLNAVSLGSHGTLKNSNVPPVSQSLAIFYLLIP